MKAVYLIPAFPLITGLLLLFFGNRFNGKKAGLLGTIGVAASFGASCFTWLALLMRHYEFRSQHFNVLQWASIGSLEINFAFLVDPLSMVMVLFVTGVSMLIHIYSISYMKGDKRYAQFFMYMNFFVFSMVVLVLADSFLLLFLGWEGVGVCSYFLIGHWFEKRTAATAAKKAFVVNRIGDMGLLVAMFLIFLSLGTLQFTNANGDGVFELAKTLSSGTATTIALLLFVGAVGKSAQLPLFVWLPDAMEGPTPVSALIHAATMVTAGVYLMVRAAPFLDMAPNAALVVAVVGGASALFAATVACAQNDIKRVLAYSTMSQLGYMFLAVGAGAYVAGVFHMVTHAFFKALLFLAAGSVIHALAEQQDIKHMGGLRRFIPITYVLFLIGWLSLSGVPPFSGFWSKDLILLSSWDYNKVLWGVALATVAFTAYYMTRLFLLAFWGKPRWDERKQSVHESSVVMIAPMAILAILSVVGGLLETTYGPVRHALEMFLRFHVAEQHAISRNTEHALMAASVAVALVGVGLAFLVFRRSRSEPWPSVLEPVALRRAWFADSLNEIFVAKPGIMLAKLVDRVIDNMLINGLVNAVVRAVSLGGGGIRRLQTGLVRTYALAVATGVIALLTWVIIRSAQ